MGTYTKVIQLGLKVIKMWLPSLWLIEKQSNAHTHTYIPTYTHTHTKKKAQKHITSRNLVGDVESVLEMLFLSIVLLWTPVLRIMVDLFWFLIATRSVA